MTIAENIAAIRRRMAEAARQSGRSPEQILLCAAGKQNDADRIRQAVEAGVDAVGENRTDEMVAKLAQGAYTGAPLHFIGHLQRNKAKYVVGTAALIHSADSLQLLSLVDRLALERNLVQEVLVEVNIGREPAKSGVAPEDLDEFLFRCCDFGHIRVRGLMAIPPVPEPGRDNRRFFSAMHELFFDITEKKYDNVDMCYLSMGMSADYCDAILEGANIVRIGTGIFGHRDYHITQK